MKSLLATAALAVMIGSMATPPPSPGDVAVAYITVEPTELHFGHELTELPVEICNRGTWGCWWWFRASDPWMIVPADEHLAAGECKVRNFRVDRDGLPDDEYTGTVEGVSVYSGPRVWVYCMRGPDQVYVWPECYPLDRDLDGDVDLLDYAMMSVGE